MNSSSVAYSVAYPSRDRCSRSGVVNNRHRRDVLNEKERKKWTLVHLIRRFTVFIHSSQLAG
jgi:hypothetical protein